MKVNCSALFLGISSSSSIFFCFSPFSRFFFFLFFYSFSSVFSNLSNQYMADCFHTPQPLVVKTTNIWTMIPEMSLLQYQNFFYFSFWLFCGAGRNRFPFYFLFFFDYFFFLIHLTFLLNLIFLMGKKTFTHNYLVYFLPSFGLSVFNGFIFKSICCSYASRLVFHFFIL